MAKKKKKHSTNVRYDNNNFLEEQRCQDKNRTSFGQEPSWLTCTLLHSTPCFWGSVSGPGEVFLPGVLLPFFQLEAAQTRSYGRLGVAQLSMVPAGLGQEQT